MGEAAGGEGGDVAGGLGRETGPVSRSARGMTGYLLYPRPEAWAKALIAPAFFVFAASSTGRFGNWKNFLVLWLILEYLIYPARYQWNDIRGIDADREHAEKDARSRLPVGTTARSRRRSIRVSGPADRSPGRAGPAGAVAGRRRVRHRGGVRVVAGVA